MQQQTILTLEDAQRVLDAVVSALQDDSRSAAVAVADEHGELLAFARTDGCVFPSINNAINKAFTAARERRSTKELRDASFNDPFPMTNFGDLRYCAWMGGIPLMHEGKVIGAVGVSGMPEAEDHEYALVGVEAL